MESVVELFVKASYYDKDEFGSCPINQTWFMAFYILVKNKLINLKVTPVNLELPPDSYVELEVSRKLPVAKIESGINPVTGKDFSNYVAETTDDLEKLISVWKCPQLQMPSDNPEVAKAEKISTEVLKSFNIFLISKSDKAIKSTLTKIEDYLMQNNSKFLHSDEVTYTDCVLMPRLQHVRVAGRELAGFDIPKEFKYIRKYIKNMYEDEVFQITCPKNRDIIVQHEDKVNVLKSRRSIMIKDETKLLSIDVDID